MKSVRGCEGGHVGGAEQWRALANDTRAPAAVDTCARAPRCILLITVTYCKEPLFQLLRESVRIDYMVIV